MIAGSSTPSPKLGSTIHLLGTLVTFKATAAETEGSFSLVEVATAVGQGTPPHFQRDDAEAFYILEGSYEIFLAGRIERHGPGSFVYVPKGVAHGFRNAGDTVARMLIINVPGGIHENFFADAGEPVADAASFPVAGPPDMPKLLQACARYGIEMLPPAP